ncbi:MAG: P-loop NTPase [Rickettsiales bacterium]|nr:P-loop NTPase [Rickettsiales bacterium]
MTPLIKTQIQTKIANICFSDNSKVGDRVSEIIVKGKEAGFALDIKGITLEEANEVRNHLIGELEKIPSLERINIVLTSSERKHEQKQKSDSKIVLDNIKKVIVIAAGKGGVGKSTIAALLAQKLAGQGKKVGLLDADIYGPSIPSIFNLRGKPELINKRMIPLYNYNVKVNSIGFITDPLSSISWRGPMTSKALYQLISLTDWGQLDYLIIDMPPGTGDIHLSLLQNYVIGGVIMITTPQKISAIDVQRAVNLYRKFNVPIIGIIENMSGYFSPNSEKITIFSGNSGKRIANEQDLTFLSKISLIPELSELCDEGLPLGKYFDLLDFAI